MFSLAFAIAIELIPAEIPQGQVARLKAPMAAVSARFDGQKVPLFTQSDGARHGLVPIPALTPPGPKEIQVLDAAGAVIGSAALLVRDGRFRKQNVTLGKAVTALRATKEEMETIAGLRNTVTPERYWSEPFRLPVPGCMTSPYGVQRLHNGKPTGNFHSGIDQRGAEGVPVHAITDGVARVVRKFNVHGNLVGLDHGEGVVSFYLHLSSFATKEGALVKKGDVIGMVGSTGRSSAPHLHWGLNVNGIPVNPTQWVSLNSCSPATPAKSAPQRRKKR